MAEKSRFASRRTVLLGAVVVLSFLLRIYLAAHFYGGTNDVSAWEQFASYWRRGKCPYDATHRWSYSPLWYWVLSLCSGFASLTRIPFTFVIKWPLILTDAMTTALIYRASRKLGADPVASLTTAVFFAANPVSIILSGYGAQFDNLAVFFVLLSWYLIRFGSEDKFFWKPVTFAIGVVVKHFNLLLAPAFAFKQRGFLKKLLFLTLPPLLFAALLVPYYREGGECIRHQVLGYNLHSGYWGWSGIICRLVLYFTKIELNRLPWFHFLDYFNDLLYLAIFALSYVWAKKYDLLDLLIAVFLTFYVFTTQISPQYTVWILPMAALRRNRYFYWYILIGGIQLGVFYYCHYYWEHHIPMPPATAFLTKVFIVARHLTWLVTVAWFWWIVKKGRGIRKSDEILSR